LVEGYKKIISDDIYKQTLLELSYIRNKFIHEPHNISAAGSVGGKASCSMSLYYKEKLIPAKRKTKELTQR